MLEKLWLNLQLFGDGGDGGDGSPASTTGEQGVDNAGENIPASIPEKAKKYYQKAMEKTKGNTKVNSKQSESAQPTNEQSATEKTSYADLIKSDEYKEEHKAYMDKAIGDRLKRFKGIEEDLGKHKELLDIVANKYGVSPDDENFLEVLHQKIDADDSYYENYAMEHDMTTEEARRIVTMERKVAQADAQKAAMEKQEQMRQHMMLLHRNAEKTQAQFPEFDLETWMQDEKFRRLCAASNGDTTAAYMACNYGNLIQKQVQMATQKVQAQTAQAVAANKARPIENGLSSSAPSVVTQDFRNMDLKQLRQYAEEQRRKQAGR